MVYALSYSKTLPCRHLFRSCLPRRGKIILPARLPYVNVMQSLLQRAANIDTEVADARKEANEMSGAQRADELRRNIWRQAVTTVFLYSTGGSRSSGISGNNEATLHMSKRFILIKP